MEKSVIALWNIRTSLDKNNIIYIVLYYTKLLQCNYKADFVILAVVTILEVLNRIYRELKTFSLSLENKYIKIQL